MIQELADLIFLANVSTTQDGEAIRWSRGSRSVNDRPTPSPGSLLSLGQDEHQQEKGDDDHRCRFQVGSPFVEGGPGRHWLRNRSPTGARYFCGWLDLVAAGCITSFGSHVELTGVGTSALLGLGALTELVFAEIAAACSRLPAVASMNMIRAPLKSEERSAP